MDVTDFFFLFPGAEKVYPGLCIKGVPQEGSEVYLLVLPLWGFSKIQLLQPSCSIPTEPASPSPARGIGQIKKSPALTANRPLPGRTTDIKIS